ncbi:MAG: helix-turn-helix domain-containing protein [Pseudomonadota bacterium]
MNSAHNRELNRLREQLEMKEAQIAALQTLVSDRKIQFPHDWELTRIQVQILRLLLKRNIATPEQIHAFLYADREDGGPDVGNVRVHICLLRKKLKRHNVVISWIAGEGYSLSYEMKDLIRKASVSVCDSRAA